MTRRIHPIGVLVAALMPALAACGGGSSGSSNPTSPSPSPSPGGGGTPVATTTITITSNGVSPNSIAVSPGSRVLFVNNDNRAHDMASDPHPDHTTCPELNQVGFLQPGQSRETGNLNTVRTCGFHDHNLPTVANLQGTIQIR
jgi:plastocyanin